MTAAFDWRRADRGVPPRSRRRDAVRAQCACGEHGAARLASGL